MIKGNIISARRAKAELKQFVKGVRSDGFGKYTCNIFAVNKTGYLIKLIKPEEVDRINNGVMKFLIQAS